MRANCSTRNSRPPAKPLLWAFDATAQAQNPVPGWRPGQPSPNGEARTFYYWYVDNLAGTFTFLFNEIHRYYNGYIAPTTPGQGIWDGSADQLISRNLNDPLNICCYGTQQLLAADFRPPARRQPGDPPLVQQPGRRLRRRRQHKLVRWSSARQQAYLAGLYGRPIYGENPGRNAYDTSGGADPRTTMGWDFDAVRSYGYLGVMWVREAEMSQPGYATLAQYANLIAQYR